MRHKPAFLALAAILAFTLTALAQTKRPFTHQDFDAWKSIQAQQLSRDGKWVAYALMPQDGDGEIIVRNIASGTEWKTKRGYRPPQPPPDPSEPGPAPALGQALRTLRPVFTADSRFLLFTIEPTKAELNQAKKDKKKPEEMPKNALAIMNLSNGQVTRIEKVKSFQSPEDAAGWVAYQLEANPEDKKPEAEAPKPGEDTEDQQRGGRAVAGGRPSGNRKEFGSDLVLRNLTTGAERTFAHALDFSFSKDAKTLVYTVAARAENLNGVFIATPGNDSPPVELLAGKGKYTRLTWDEGQTQLAFTSDRDEAGAKQPKFKIYHWTRNSNLKAVEIVSTANAGFRSGLIISDNANLSFSQDGSKLFLGVAPPSEPEKDPNSDDNSDDKVSVDLWHYQDDFIQPMQKVRAGQERNRSYRAVYHLKEKKFVQLADETMNGLNPADKGSWALGTDDREYRRLVGVDTNYSDVYLVNIMNGTRKPLLKKNQFGVTWSPNGKYGLVFDGKDWNTISVPDGKLTNLTAKLGVKFWREDHDSPSTAPAYGNGGWVKDDKAVLLYDQFDIWQVAPDGSSAKNLTDGVGRKEKIEFRYAKLDSEDRFIDPSKPLLLRAENVETRDSGFYRDKLDGGLPERLHWAAKNFTNPTKAKDADVLLLTASRFDEYPDLLLTNLSLKDLKKVSNEGTQLDKFTWGKAELVSFRNTDGVALSGILVKPENFDPSKKYPMIVYIYEKLSNTLHNFTHPTPTNSINRYVYASNGYLVFMPDIVYTIGYPGQSAMKCVMPGVQAVIDQGFVDENAIGIQGHSWGGYQIAYMVTQTNRFKAAAPGAVVANMTSAYSGIRWGTGLSRQFQYERTQSRIGGSLWEYTPCAFWKTRPCFVRIAYKHRC
jgi:dipeptidyl aminopeptidase/acylaminoacyl peptidase